MHIKLKAGLLVFSFFTITVIGLLYGVSPAWFSATFLSESSPPSTDQAHILRAVMTLYLALGGFWLWSAFSEEFRDAGVLVLCIFCAGLVAGRILSVAVDGRPSTLLLVYIAMELAIVPICIWLQRPTS